MAFIGEWIRRLGYLIRRRAKEDELRREMEAHRAEMGAPPAFGNTLRLREEARDAWGWRWLDDLVQDSRFAWRMLRRSPGFTLTTIGMLAVGIGVNTAIFSALDSLLLRPLAVRHLDRTVIVYDTTEKNADAGTSFPTFQLMQERRDTFASVMAIAGARSLSMIDGDRRAQVFAELVTADFFSIADVALQIGRPLGGDIDRVVDPASVAVLSHSFWKRRFHGDPTIVGKTIVLNGQPFVVMAIAREGFTGLDARMSADLWIPMTTWAHLIDDPGRLTGDERWITTIAELQPGVTVDQAQTAVAVATRRMAKAPGQQTHVRPARQRSMPSASEALAIGGVAFAGGLLVLALASANVMSLLLARAAARQREMSVRMALGGSRARVVRLWLSETLVLCFVAGLIGLIMAAGLLDLVVAFKPPAEIGESQIATLPIDFRLDLRVFAFSLGLSALVAGIIGLISGLQGSRPGVTREIKSARVTDRFAPGLNLRSAVIALQVSLSLLLLVPCALFVRSWSNSSAMTPGFSADGVLLLPISSHQAGVSIRKPLGFEQQLADRIAAAPSVESATVMDPVPLWFGGKFSRFAVEGTAEAAAGGGHRIGYSAVGLGYFDTLRIPLLTGRDFDRSDTASAPLVAIVNGTLARQLWPGGNVVGQRLRTHDGVLEVVGIARDAKYLSLAETNEPWVYRPIAQSPSDNLSLSLAVRTSGNSEQVRAAIEREVKSLIPSWPSFQFRTLDEGVQLQRSLPRFGAMLLGGLGAFGALLAAVGLYGVLAYVVQQRSREIGIRLALGAPGFSVVGLIIRQGMAVCAAGGSLGLLVALGATQFLRSLLFGVSPADPIAYATVLSLLLGVAFLACYLPARHASKVNPVEVLKRE